MIFNLSISDIINITSTVVNSILAIWIVRTLQNNLANKRYLKDYIITEIKDLRLEYKNFLNELHSGKLKPKKIVPWFKLMSIRLQDTMEIVSGKYEIDKGILKNYQLKLKKIVTEFEEFNSNYKENKCFELTEKSLKEIVKFQQENNYKFNYVILKINEK